MPAGSDRLGERGPVQSLAAAAFTSPTTPGASGLPAQALNPSSAVAFGLFGPGGKASASEDPDAHTPAAAVDWDPRGAGPSPAPQPPCTASCRRMHPHGHLGTWGSGPWPPPAMCKAGVVSWSCRAAALSPGASSDPRPPPPPSRPRCPWVQLSVEAGFRVAPSRWRRICCLKTEGQLSARVWTGRLPRGSRGSRPSGDLACTPTGQRDELVLQDVVPTCLVGL